METQEEEVIQAELQAVMDTKSEVDSEETLTIEIDGVEYNKDDVVWSDYLGEYLVAENAREVYISGDMDYADEDDADFAFMEDRGEYHHIDDGYMCEVRDEWFMDDMTRSYCDTTGNEQSFCDSDYWRWIERGTAADTWLYEDDATYCEDIDEYVHCDDAHWCEEDECSYWDEDNMTCTADGHIKGYHSNKSPYNYNSGFFKSPFSIGFEIEKKNFINDNGDTASNRGDFVGEFDFFEGFETDSSCGVEGVSNIMPLSPPRSKHRKRVFEMIDDAKCIIDSPSNKNCGGHITVSYKDITLDGYELVNRMREHLALMYALYRFRLAKSYCSQNKPAKKENNTKYSPINVKGNRVEFRLPSQVKNTKQLKLRYDLVYLTMYHSLIEPVNFNVFLNKASGIVKQMYNGNEDKVNNIFKLAKDFRRYLSAEDVSDNINEFINPNDN